VNTIEKNTYIYMIFFYQHVSLALCNVPSSDILVECTTSICRVAEFGSGDGAVTGRPTSDKAN
jgi:hypothetical protein